MTKEMRDTIWDMITKADNYDCETACETCPYADRCHSEKLFYGCPVWEDSMGEDL